MSDKLNKAQWTAFVQAETKNIHPAVELADKDLVKALANVDKTDADKPGPRLEALKELIKEIPRQVVALAKLKKALGDKPFGKLKDRLYEILAEAEALQKKTQTALDAGDDDEDDDAKPNALLDPKLLFKQLTMCRKDPERTMKFAFVDARGKEQPAILALHPRLGARAMFAKLQAAAGVKTGAYGSAWVDGMSLMLQLDKPMSGLVKKVRQPVKACGFRITKAVLWNEDGTVFEQDEAPDDAAGDAATPAAPGSGAASGPAPGAQSQPAPGAPVEPPAGVPTAPPQPAATYAAKLATLQPRVRKAADEGSADAAKHQRLLEFAAGKAASQDFLGAVAALRQVEQLLDKATSPPGGNGNAGTALAEWKSQREAAVKTLKDVATRIAAAKHARSTKAIIEIQGLVKNLTPEPTSLQQVTELQNWLGADEVVSDVCELAEDIRTPLLQALSQLRTQMSA